MLHKPNHISSPDEVSKKHDLLSTLFQNNKNNINHHNNINQQSPSLAAASTSSSLSNPSSVGAHSNTNDLGNGSLTQQRAKARLEKRRQVLKKIEERLGIKLPVFPPKDSMSTASLSLVPNEIQPQPQPQPQLQPQPQQQSQSHSQTQSQSKAQSLQIVADEPAIAGDDEYYSDTNSIDDFIDANDNENNVNKNNNKHNDNDNDSDNENDGAQSNGGRGGQIGSIAIAGTRISAAYIQKKRVNDASNAVNANEYNDANQQLNHHQQQQRQQQQQQQQQYSPQSKLRIDKIKAKIHHKKKFQELQVLAADSGLSLDILMDHLYQAKKEASVAVHQSGVQQARIGHMHDDDDVDDDDDEEDEHDDGYHDGNGNVNGDTNFQSHSVNKNRKSKYLRGSDNNVNDNHYDSNNNNNNNNNNSTEDNRFHYNPNSNSYESFADQFLHMNNAHHAVLPGNGVGVGGLNASMLSSQQGSTHSESHNNRNNNGYSSDTYNRNNVDDENSNNNGFFQGAGPIGNSFLTQGFARSKQAHQATITSAMIQQVTGPRVLNGLLEDFTKNTVNIDVAEVKKLMKEIGVSKKKTGSSSTVVVLFHLRSKIMLLTQEMVELILYLYSAVVCIRKVFISLDESDVYVQMDWHPHSSPSTAHEQLQDHINVQTKDLNNPYIPLTEPLSITNNNHSGPSPKPITRMVAGLSPYQIDLLHQAKVAFMNCAVKKSSWIQMQTCIHKYFPPPPPKGLGKKAGIELNDRKKNRQSNLEFDNFSNHNGVTKSANIHNNNTSSKSGSVYDELIADSYYKMNLPEMTVSGKSKTFDHPHMKMTSDGSIQLVSFPKCTPEHNLKQDYHSLCAVLEHVNANLLPKNGTVNSSGALVSSTTSKSSNAGTSIQGTKDKPITHFYSKRDMRTKKREDAARIRQRILDTSNNNSQSNSNVPPSASASASALPLPGALSPRRLVYRSVSAAEIAATEAAMNTKNKDFYEYPARPLTHHSNPLVRALHLTDIVSQAEDNIFTTQPAFFTSPKPKPGTVGNVDYSADNSRVGTAASISGSSSSSLSSSSSTTSSSSSSSSSSSAPHQSGTINLTNPANNPANVNNVNNISQLGASGPNASVTSANLDWTLSHLTEHAEADMIRRQRNPLSSSRGGLPIQAGGDVHAMNSATRNGGGGNINNSNQQPAFENFNNAGFDVYQSKANSTSSSSSSSNNNNNNNKNSNNRQFVDMHGLPANGSIEWGKSFPMDLNDSEFLGFGSTNSHGRMNNGKSISRGSSGSGSGSGGGDLHSIINSPTTGIEILKPWSKGIQ
jgi:hypothetical protein